MKKNLKFLLCSSVIGFMFFSPTKIFGVDNIEEVDHHNIATAISTHLSKNPSLLSSSEGKDIVVFLGKTGAGKSTLINYLSKKKLKADHLGDIFLENPEDPSAMPIGEAAGSKTLLPSFIQTDEFLFYDLPGFGDTRGPATELINAFFIKRIIENADKVKLVFVAGEDEITAERGQHFQEFLTFAQNLIQNDSIQAFSCLIITKVSRQFYQRPEYLAEFLKRKVDIERIKNLNHWLSSGLIGLMPKPMTGEVGIDDIPPILAAIRKTSSKKISEFNVDSLYNAEEKCKIKIICDKEIEKIAIPLIQQKIPSYPSYDFSSFDSGALIEHKLYFEQGFSLELSSKLEESSPMFLYSIFPQIYEASKNVWIIDKKMLIKANVEIEIAKQERAIAEQKEKKAEADAAKMKKDKDAAEREAQRARRAKDAAEREAQRARRAEDAAEREAQRVRADNQQSIIRDMAATIVLGAVAIKYAPLVSDTVRDLQRRSRSNQTLSQPISPTPLDDYLLRYSRTSMSSTSTSSASMSSTSTNSASMSSTSTSSASMNADSISSASIDPTSISSTKSDLADGISSSASAMENEQPGCMVQ